MIATIYIKTKSPSLKSANTNCLVLIELAQIVEIIAGLEFPVIKFSKYLTNESEKTGLQSHL